MRELAGSTLGGARESAWGIYRHLDTRFDEHNGALFYYLKPAPRPCFTYDVLQEIRELQTVVQRIVKRQLTLVGTSSLHYLVACSGATDGVHYGGDLDFFLQAIRTGDRNGLTDYARLGVEVLYQNYTNLETGLRTIALVRGQTVGAGFEAALSCDMIIAEKAARLGFPEVLFNMFPGMGAYSFIARRSSPHFAEQMIMKGRLQTAVELYDQGLIDILSDEGDVEGAFRRFCQTEKRVGNTRDALLRIRQIIGPVTREELQDIASIWVEAAFRLSESNLDMMERLLNLQNRKVGEAGLRMTASGA